MIECQLKIKDKYTCKESIECKTHVRQLIPTPITINKLTKKYLFIDLPFFTLNVLNSFF